MSSHSQNTCAAIQKSKTLDELLHILGTNFGVDNMRKVLDTYHEVSGLFAKFQAGELSPVEIYDAQKIVAKALDQTWQAQVFDMIPDWMNAVYNLNAASDNVDLVKEFQAAGDALVGELLPSIEKAKEIAKQIASDEDRLDELEFQFEKEEAYGDAWWRHKEARETKQKYLNGEIRYKEYIKQREIFKKEIERDAVKINPALKPLYMQIEDLREHYMDKIDSIHSKTKETLLSNSPVSLEEAEAWCKENVFFSKEAIKALQEQDYPVEILKADMCDIYRLLNGKLGPVRFAYDKKEGERAFALDGKQIFVQKFFKKTTLYHEMGHIADSYDQTARDTCQKFIKERATGSPVSLAKLTGEAYGKNEKAYPDNFFKEYVGKVYPDGGSEVFSMGLQCLATPTDLLDILTKDQEHFKMLAGMLKHNLKIADDELEKRKNDLNRLNLLPQWLKAIDAVSKRLFDLFFKKNSDTGLRETSIYKGIGLRRK